MSRLIRRTAAIAALLLASPVAAQAVGDKDSVTLDPAGSYLIVQTSSGSSMYSFPLTFIRRPEQIDIDNYVERRAEALAKARAKWEKKFANWQKDMAKWKPGGGIPKPVKPVEPTDANLAYPSLDQENMLMVGPFNRFAKGDGRSTFIHRVPPGRYVFYGPVNFAVGAAGTCMCMGSIEFEVKPGQIVNAGMMKLNWLAERAVAKKEGRPVPRNELDLPESMNTISWIPAEPGTALDPRLAGYTIVPADLRASGRIPNYFGIQIDRLTPVPGVLDYDHDRIVDLKGAK
jgi:hypothetical protein